MEIPKIVAQRLALYHRCLRNMYESGKKLVSSYDIGKLLDLKPSQVRKDLSYFGAFGVKGKGYDVKYLIKMIERILGINRTWKAILIGVGNLGRAILNYDELKKCGFEIVGIFDNDPNKVGNKFVGKLIRSTNEIEDFIRKNNVNIAIIAVPPRSAQEVVDALISYGIRFFVNFSPAKLKVPKNVLVENVDISIPFKVLSFRITGLEEIA